MPNAVFQGIGGEILEDYWQQNIFPGHVMNRISDMHKLSFFDD